MYYLEQHFERINTLETGDYELCVFENCDFSNQNFSSFSFTDCRFINCNLSLLSIGGTSWIDVNCVECKIMGVKFDKANPIGFHGTFENCNLEHCSFYQIKMKKTKFVSCVLRGVDFTETDLSESVFDRCDLKEATFDKTNLEKVDFRTSFHFRIDPTANRMKKSIFSKNDLAGLLEQFQLIIED